MVVTHWYYNIDNSHDPHTQEDVQEQGGEARRMTNLTNRLICRIKGHKLFMLNIESIDIQYDQYTGLGYVYCVRCKAYLPTDNLD